MRGLVVLSAAMGVLIVAGVAVIAVTIARRVAAVPEAAVAAILDEPAGTHIAQVAASADRVVLRLEGGGPDRVLLLDPRSLRVVGRVALAR